MVVPIRSLWRFKLLFFFFFSTIKPTKKSDYFRPKPPNPNRLLWPAPEVSDMALARKSDSEARFPLLDRPLNRQFRKNAYYYYYFWT